MDASIEFFVPNEPYKMSRAILIQFYFVLTLFDLTLAFT